MLASTRFHHQFAAESVPFSLWRLRDAEYDQLRSQSFRIEIDGWWLLKLALDRRGPDELNLPKALLVMEAEFGHSSTYLDDYKQTFSFPFLLAITKPSGTFYHLLTIADYKGGLEFWLYRIVDDLKYSDERLDRSHQPIAAEFSADEIKYVISYLWGFLEGYASQLGKRKIQPFFRHVDSSHVIYGYWDGEFVEEEIDDSEEYQQMVRTLRTKYGKPAISETEKVNCAQAMIQAIVRPLKTISD
jgi:hypothetical protein